ncbi:AraC family transcriptional regulator [Paenibacillus sp. FSL W8-1187]|uniref:AraC family transcriptional regulator n=1 Tax=Paenibacillus sp. FSL W8-1187 TaxID=2975339 RepID=UPI0030D6E215
MGNEMSPRQGGERPTGDPAEAEEADWTGNAGLAGDGASMRDADAAGNAGWAGIAGLTGIADLAGDADLAQGGPFGFAQGKAERKERFERLREARGHNEARRLFGSYEYRYGPGEHVIEAHWHEEMEWLYVAEGETLLQIGTESLLLRAGEAAFVPSGELHAAHASGSAGCRFFALVFHGALLSGAAFDAVEERVVLPLLERRAMFPRQARPQEPAGALLLGELAHIRQACRQRPPGWEAAVKGRLLLMLAGTHALGAAEDRRAGADGGPSSGVAADAAKVERLKRVISHLQEHYGRPIRIAELAGLAAMSEGHFSRFFREMTGQTPIAYLNALRIRRAAERLRRTELRIADIALECGFDNISYFVRQFQRQLKETPSAFRRRNGQK